jgi:transcriptional regulator of arginine metabolism
MIKDITPTARKTLVAKLIASELIDSQEALVHALKKAGVVVTQATASRDLLDLGAHRERDREGVMRYVLATKTIVSPNSNLLLSASASGNLVILRTPPGGAQLLASSLDQSGIENLIGTIAGDDTVMAVASTAQGGARLSKEIEDFLGSTHVKSARSKISKKKTQPKKR